jgi:hypothetical protein
MVRMELSVGITTLLNIRETLLEGPRRELDGVARLRSNWRRYE